MLLRCAAVLGLLLTGAAAAQPVPEAGIGAEVSDQARAVFDRARDKLLQIRILHRTTQAQTAIGSGWIATSDGLLVTNYHVVSLLVLEPERYTAEFVRSDGSHGPLQVLAVDVVHDLAVARMTGTELPAFRLHEGDLRKGNRGFSMGNPLDLGLTIVEGTYNGLQENTLTERFNFTGAINPGMSGGPAVTADGRVFGINVATMRNGQLLSFVVPVRFARELLSRAPPTPPAGDRLRKDLEAQLTDRQHDFLSPIAGRTLPVSPLGRYTVPDSLGPYMRCWGGGSDPDRTRPYEIVFKSCDAQSDLFVGERLYSGGLQFRHELITGRALGALRFSTLYERRYSAAGGGAFATFEDVTPFRCHDRYVTTPSGTLRGAICLRGYKRLEGLYDLRVKLATLDQDTEGLVSALSVDGIALENALALARRYLEAFSWTK
ncbi:MAG: trypsin-like peptidase domain-containing protein [Burkholderiales bacterium]|nr:trypsin-like peptidase domain-containing protein [Burkholderiales bacterium]